MLSLLKNKHCVTALIVSPILAVLAYLGVDSRLAEKPQVAEQGQAYKLAVKSNCRYKSGVCTLQNHDVSLTVKASHLTENRVSVAVTADMALQQVVLGVVSSLPDSKPVAMSQVDDSRLVWSTELSNDLLRDVQFRLVANVQGANYYAEFPSVFIDYETIFPRDNFGNLQARK